LWNQVAADIEKHFRASPPFSEVFCGGCGLGLKLLGEGKVSHLYLNDLDRGVYNFWFEVLNNTEEFVSWVYSVPVTLEEWYLQKDKLVNGDGRAFFFLNRTCVSGVVTGGVIGGRSQQSKYKIDVRFNKPALIAKIREVAKLRDKITISNLDFSHFLSGNNHQGSLYFVDPPYVKKSDWLYTQRFTAEDHERLASVLHSHTDKHFILTYDNEEKIRSLYSAWLSRDVDYFYGTSNSAGKELLLTNAW